MNFSLRNLNTAISESIDSNSLRPAAILATVTNKPLDELCRQLQLLVFLIAGTIPIYCAPCCYIRDKATEAFRPITILAHRVMLHLALSGNVLCSLGVSPVLYDPNYIGPQCLIREILSKLGPVTNLNFQKLSNVVNVNVDNLTPSQHGVDIPKLTSPIQTAASDIVASMSPLTAKLSNVVNVNVDNLTPSQYIPKLTCPITAADIVASMSPLTAVAGSIGTAAQHATGIIVKALGSYGNKIKFETPKQFSSEDGIWPENKGGLTVVKDIQSAQKALEAVTEGFNPGKFVEILASIAKDAFFSVVPNPQTDDYKGKKFYEVSLTCDAAYCLLLLSLQNLWREEDLQARKDLVHFNINPLMKRIVPCLGAFLVMEQIGALSAAPCFNFYRFEQDPLKELRQRSTNAIDAYTGHPARQNALKEVDNMIAKCIPTKL